MNQPFYLLHLANRDEQSIKLFTADQAIMNNIYQRAYNDFVESTQGNKNPYHSFRNPVPINPPFVMENLPFARTILDSLDLHGVYALDLNGARSELNRVTGLGNLIPGIHDVLIFWLYDGVTYNIEMINALDTDFKTDGYFSRILG